MMDTWVKLTEEGEFIQYYDQSNSNYGLRVGFSSAEGKFWTQLYRVGTPTCYSSVKDPTIWHHIAVTWNKSTYENKLFIDGIEECSLIGNSNDLLVKPRLIQLGDEIVGGIANFRFYDSSVNIALPVINYNSEKVRFGY